MIKPHQLYAPLIMLFSLGVSNAQNPANGWVIENIHGPSQVGIVDTIPVDINHDGLMDVVSASIEDGHLRAYINQGNLEFEQQYISTDVLGAYRVSATDINNDGEIDFLIPSIETNEIIALIADPNAKTFGYRKQIIAEGVLLPTDAQAGDFNNDGLMDVVSLSFEDNTVLLHLQDAQGQFRTDVVTKATQRPRKLVIEDFNDDQLPDFLVASSEDNSVRLFSNDGLGSFNSFLISDQMTGIRYIAKCDVVDADYPDFVAGVTEANQVVLFTNNENNTFSSAVIDADLPGADVVDCADIDQDQVLELVSISRTHGNIYNQEIFGPPNKQLIANTRDGYITAKVVSLTANQAPLILTQAFFENRNLVYTPNLANHEQVIWEDFPEGVISIQHDKLPPFTVYAAGYSSGAIYGYLNGVVDIVFTGYKGLRGMHFIDFNYDLAPDIFSLNSENNTVTAHTNDGFGNFLESLVSSEVAFPTATQGIDILGELNVLVGNTFNQNLWAFDGLNFNSLGGSYYGTFALDVADINNDGFDDVVIADYLGGNISVAFQNEFGDFIKTTVSSNKPRAFSVKAIDLDNDSDLDIISTANLNNEVWWHENNGLNFTDHLISAAVIQPRDIDVISRAGHSYIAVSSFTKNTGGVYLFDTINGSTFTVNHVVSNNYGVNTLDFVSQSDGLSLLIGGFNDSSLIKITQIDLIFLSSF